MNPSLYEFSLYQMSLPTDLLLEYLITGHMNINISSIKMMERNRTNQSFIRTQFYDAELISYYVCNVNILSTYINISVWMVQQFNKS